MVATRPRPIIFLLQKHMHRYDKSVGFVCIDFLLFLLFVWLVGCLVVCLAFAVSFFFFFFCLLLLFLFSVGFLVFVCFCLLCLGSCIINKG